MNPLHPAPNQRSPRRLAAPRRDFVKWVVVGTAMSMVGGKIWQRDLLAYCAPQNGVPNGTIKVRISDYPALQQSWGSVRLGLNPITSGDPYPDGDYYPILINRDDANNFYVLDCECMHQGCVVPIFDLSDSGIHCPCHGSRYWIDGSVVNGPTQAPLGAYPFTYDGQVITIKIPCWAFTAHAQLVAPGATSRLRIDFTAGANTTYLVNSSTNPAGPWTPTSFATTPTGPANQTSLVGAGNPTSVYVVRTAAVNYYAVSAKLVAL